LPLLKFVNFYLGRQERKKVKRMRGKKAGDKKWYKSEKQKSKSAKLD